ncbi:DUF3616 domain-containing protein [Rhizobium ruizarguesonis]|uniref:DUF3616 domain-containing protein n=1 Tax=Rhizobium ruizarguesonis TaxID=2081791 RepID=UPI0010308C2B|nr:DUF3616 domain-containing protein [Rhizobium ruizarguesonis]TBC68296.1 DUF3616 domain-containing protein [Rhizobium ruizarguesonis]TBD93668.1 DUF3616 domain-containing protein [Rhizobium ruizarguesonis]TBF03667.1 DUF3616 domain-containing protein [Rhizobium ruizarguesonis]
MRNGNCLIFLVSGSLLVVPAPVKAESRSYVGICEASAAALIDASHVAIASDDYDAILVYERGKPQSVARLEVSDATDIEAAARIGDMIFWLTSHSVNKNGEDKKKRKVLFTTKVGANGELSNAGPVYRNLRADIAGALGRREGRLAPFFNIEGMTATPEGHLLIGLRGPETIIGDKAILVEVENPMQLVSIAASEAVAAKIARVVTLDLSDGPEASGRGVRDIVRVDDRYLIVGGSEPDGDDPPPKLFWWDGKSGDDATPGPHVDFSGMTPEAIIAWSNHDGEVFSDNGGAMIQGEECADKAPPVGAFFPSLDIQF